MRVALFAAIVLAGQVAAAPAQVATGDELQVVEVCLPQLPACVPPSHPCASFAPPDGHASLLLRLTQAGRPVRYAQLDGPEGPLRTDARGLARLGVEATTGARAILVTAQGGTSARHDIEWSDARVAPSASSVDAYGGDAVLGFRVVTESGAGIAGARVLVEGPDGGLHESEASDPGGAAALRVTAGLDGDHVILDVDACGLPMGGGGATRVRWHASPARAQPIAAPTLHAVPDAWSADPLRDARVEGGSSPLRLEWRLAGGDAWRPAPLDLPDGPHVVEVVAVDAAGSRSSPLAAAVRLDRAAPRIGDVVLDAAPACGTSRLALVDGGAGVAPRSVSVSLDGAPLGFAMEAGELSFAATSPGVIRIAVADLAGNVATREAPLACDPRPALRPAWVGVWPACADVAWVLEDDASATLVLDGAPAALDRSGPRVRPAALTEGTHEARFEQGTRVAWFTFSCDDSPPELRVEMPEGVLTSPTRPVVEASDAASGVAELRARLVGEPWRELTEVLVEGEGRVTLEVEARDAAGRTSAASVTRQVDTRPPRLVVLSGAEPGGSLALRVEDASAVQVTLLLGDRALGSVALDAGVHTFAVPADAPLGSRGTLVAVDAVGHEARLDVEVIQPPPPAGNDSLAPLVQASCDGGECDTLVPAPGWGTLGALLAAGAIASWRRR